MEETYKIIKFNNNNLEIDVKISPFEKTIWLSCHAGNAYYAFYKRKGNV